MTETYIQWARHFRRDELRLRADILAWLPHNIIDIHTHANGADAVGILPREALGRIYSSFPGYSVEESIALEPLFFGRSRRACLRFANPYGGIDIRRANDYLLVQARPQDLVALCAVPDDIDYTLERIASGRFVAVKSYAAYFEPPARQVLDYFCAPVLSACESDGLPIILHLPRPLTECLPQLVAILERWPRLKVILAHAARLLEATSAARAALHRVSQSPNVYCDTAAVGSAQVLQLALEELGMGRIVYGSDEPMNLLRYAYFRHPTLGVRVMAPHRYHWLPDEIWSAYASAARRVPHMHWQSLVGLRQAIDSQFKGTTADVAKERIFFHNAAELLPDFRMSARV